MKTQSELIKFKNGARIDQCTFGPGLILTLDDETFNLSQISKQMQITPHT